MNDLRKVIKEDKIVVESPSQASIRKTIESQEAQKNKTGDTRAVIMYVITRADWEKEEKNLYTLAEYFANDYRICVVYGAYQYRGNSALQQKLRELGVELYPLRKLTDKIILFNEISVIWQLAKLLYELDPVVVHSYDTKTSLLLGMARGLLRHKARFVASMYTSDRRESDRNTLAERFTRWLRTRSYRMADCIIVGDEYLESEARAQLADSSRVHLVRPGISDINFVDPVKKRQAMAGEVSAILGEKIRNSNTIILGNIAPLEPEHNLVFILQALSQLEADGYSFVYFHYGEGSQRVLLEHEIKRFNLEQCVVLKGHDSTAERYLSVCNIVVHPSSLPGVPPLVQASGLARRALILSPTLGLQNALEDTKEVLFVPERNAEALAQKIAYLIEHPEKRRSMGLALESRVRVDYDVNEMRRLTRELYGVE
ncbi:MAG: glycosyltransferase [Patescibacteria group bacterium]